MQKNEILKRVDHTNLKPEATWEDIKKICGQGMEYHTASVCIPPCFVKKASEYVKGKVKICTVIGFPNGYHTKENKLAETLEALKNGADEIDMVINIGDVKAGEYEKVKDEIISLKEACGDRVLKVIIETCLLTEEEKIKMCGVVSESGADYIKTSTGFSASGATFEDVKLLREHVADHVKVKAAGGIGSFEDAEEFIRLGADRLGTSRLIQVN